MICDRCKKLTRVHTMSMFNQEDICLPCKDTERAHPEYKAAQDAELAAVKSGDMNFPGIGLPEDL